MGSAPVVDIQVLLSLQRHMVISDIAKASYPLKIYIHNAEDQIMYTMDGLLRYI